MIDLLILAVVCFFFAWLFIRRPELAIGLLLLVLPFYRLKFLIAGIPITLIEALILVLFGVFIFQKIRNKQKISFSNYKWLMLILMIIATLAVFYSPNKTAAMGVWKAYFLEPILFFIVFINTIKQKKDLFIVFNFLGLSIIGISILAIYQKFTGAFIPNEFWAVEETRRVTSVYGYPNAIGLYLAPLLVLYLGQAWLLFEARWRDHWRKIVFYLVVFILGLLAVIFAQSEGALIAMGVGLLLFGILIKKLRIFSFVMVGLAIVVMFVFPSINNLLITKATFSDFSGNLRLIMWQETFQMLKGSPIWGSGLFGYQIAIAPFHHAREIFEIYLYPHNLILNFWSEIGLLGLLTMIFLLIKYFFNYLKIKNRDNQSFYILLICGLVAMLVHGIVDVPYFKNDLSVLWWLFFALSWLILRSKEVVIPIDKK